MQMAWAPPSSGTDAEDSSLTSLCQWVVSRSSAREPVCGQPATLTPAGCQHPALGRPLPTLALADRARPRGWMSHPQSRPAISLQPQARARWSSSHLGEGAESGPVALSVLNQIFKNYFYLLIFI